MVGHCDTYALFGEPRAQVLELMTRINAEAADHGRRPSYNLSFRPIIGATEEEAWRKAEAILAGVEASGGGGGAGIPQAETARRLMRLIEGGMSKTNAQGAHRSGGEGKRNSTAW